MSAHAARYLVADQYPCEADHHVHLVVSMIPDEKILTH